MIRTKKIFIFLGHPNTDTFNGALASQYEQAAKDAGHEVRRMNIGEMTFDPILHEGYKVIQDLEPDLRTFQDNVRWCDHLVFITPLWWSNIPGLMKGLIDRVWLPGFGYRFKKDGPFWNKFMWEKLLKGRSAHLIITSDSPSFVMKYLFGGNLKSFYSGVLGFSGISPVRKSWFSGMKALSPKCANKILNKVARLGIKGR